MGLSPKHKQKNFFTRAEVAQLFEVAPNTVNRWVLAGRLPSVVTPGGRRRYPAGAILLMFEEQMQAAGVPVAEVPWSIDDRDRIAPDRPSARLAFAGRRDRRAPNRVRRK